MEKRDYRSYLEGEINKIIKSVMCHEHKAIKGKSIEWLEAELKHLKELYS
jgi:hypothetical protein